jgi:hypothetical protein
MSHISVDVSMRKWENLRSRRCWRGEPLEVDGRAPLSQYQEENVTGNRDKRGREKKKPKKKESRDMATPADWLPQSN